MYNETTNALRNPFKSAITDAEELVKAAATLGDENFARLRTKAEDSIRAAKAKVSETQDSVRLRAMYAAEAVDRRVSENPWETVGVVAVTSLALGFIAGMLVSRE